MKCSYSTGEKNAQSTFIRFTTVIQKKTATLLICLNENGDITGTAGVTCRSDSFRDAHSVGVIAALMMARRKKLKEVTLELEDTKVRKAINKKMENKEGTQENIIFSSLKNLFDYNIYIRCNSYNRLLRQNLPTSANIFLSHQSVGENAVDQTKL